MNSKLIKILIITENIHQAETLERILKNKYILINTQDQCKALDYLKKTDFNIILFQLEIKKGRNLKFLKNLHAQFPDIPSIMIFNKFDDEFILNAFESGIQDYIIVGEFTSINLERTIHQTISKSKMQRKLHQNAENLLMENAKKYKKKASQKI